MEVHIDYEVFSRDVCATNLDSVDNTNKFFIWHAEVLLDFDEGPRTKSCSFSFAFFMRFKYRATDMIIASISFDTRKDCKLR